MERMTTRILTTLAATALLVPAGMAPASAAPSNCTKYTGGVYGTAICSSGYGYYQAYARCEQTYWPYFHAFREGPWKKVGSREKSWVWCPFGYNVRSVGIGLSNSQ